MIKKYFPQGLAGEHVFCNREKERQELKKIIEQNEHVVLAAPRRYGKTSLLMQVLKENNFPGTRIDFFFVLTQSEVIKSIAQAVSEIINTLLPTSTQRFRKAIDALIARNPKLTVSVLGQKIEISTKHASEQTISELLLALEHVASETKTSCVLIFDEFQQISELKENHAIEASIRHAVEKSQYVSYIFCGSKRHLLNEMFSDKSRPLYHLCDLMPLHRIKQTAYVPFLNKMAQKKWAQTLPEDILSEILHLTECHPYYVNALCRHLWREDAPPTLAQVQNTWEGYITRQRDWISNELDKLTLNRRKILTALAHQASDVLQGQEFSKKTELPPSSIRKTILDLEKLDMVYEDNNKYFHVLDPAIAYFIRTHSVM